MRYCTLSASGTSSVEALTDLDKEVNRAINEGWLPQGGVSLLFRGDVIVVTQAVIKYETKEL